MLRRTSSAMRITAEDLYLNARIVLAKMNLAGQLDRCRRTAVTLEESLAYDQISDGKSKEEADDFLASKQGKQLQAYIMFAQEKYSNGETAFQFFEEFIRPNALYLLDEPEVSLSPSNQVRLAEKINEMARLLGCQFIIATHSPFMLGILNAKIYDLDSKDFKVSSWTELENVRYFYDFFEKHKAEFEEE